MTLIVIGPATKDLIITGETKIVKTGGASYFQSFVFEKFFPDYITIVNCENKDIASEFPDSNKIKILKKNNTHYFVNNYPNMDNTDIRIQSSNFANIPITKNDLKNVLDGINEIDAFILNPLNIFDFPLKTIEYLKDFDKNIYISLQGFLRHPFKEINENSYSIELKPTSDIKDKLSNIEGLFLDEREASILFDNNDYKSFNIEEIIITNGSKGSRILSNREYKIPAVKCENIVDSTGCGDTYMAAYIAKKLRSKSILKAANFASKIASDKLRFNGPFKSDF